MPSSSFTSNALIRARGIAHQKVSSKTDGADASKVLPSDWHAQHSAYGTMLDEGTAFPTTGLFTNQKFFRTDIRGSGMLFIYDGTRWVSEIFEIPLGVRDVLDGGTANYLKGAALPQDYAVYLVSANVTMVNVGTNNGSNYWTFQLFSIESPATSTSRGSSANTSADSTSTYVNKLISLGITLTTSSKFIYCQATKTGSPGGLYFFPLLQYRLIAT